MSAAPGTIALEARNLEFAYARPVLRNLSFAIRAGAVTGIIGPNGCGKTTVLKLLDGILRPACGEVRLAALGALSKLSRREIARHIAMVPQNGHGFPPHTVFEFALQGRTPHLSLFGFESERDEEVVRSALDQTCLLQLAGERASAISGGEKQRLLLARALSQEAEILLVDELTANLDINYQVELMRMIRRITRERSLATLIVSHEINLLAAFSDWAILMSQGEIRHQGPSEEVINEANLRAIFQMNFVIRRLPGASPEVMPVIEKG